MDYSLLFSDPKLKQEFLDRFTEIAASRRGGLESLDGVPSLDDAAKAVEEMTEGTWSSAGGGLEAIIQRFTRPVQLVQDGTFAPPADSFPNSVELTRRLEGARQALESAIPSVGRIDLRNHRYSWVGTGWMVGPGVVVTNRHVAEAFARANGAELEFRSTFDGRAVKASVDWRHEHGRPSESSFRVRKVLWIEPEPSFDVALLQIEGKGAEDEAPPPVVPLLTRAELAAIAPGSWLAVIGYPARDSRNKADDQQRIFDGIYDVKRLSPGQITAIRPEGIATHDATTLGGNSGSVVVDLASGKAVALHFGGIEGEANYAVLAPELATILSAHAL